MKNINIYHKTVSYLLVLLCVISLVSCRVDASMQEADNTQLDEKDKISVTSSTVQPEQVESTLFHIEELESKSISFNRGNSKGYYSVESLGAYYNIVYTDYTELQQYVLCDKEGCEHTDNSCTGYEEVNGNNSYILALEDKVVYIYPGKPGYHDNNEPVLARIDISELDGTNKRTIVEFENNIEINVFTAVAYDQDYLYMMQLLRDVTGSHLGTRFQQVNLKSGEQETIATFSDVESRDVFFLGVAGGRFVFKSIYSGEMDENLTGREQWGDFVYSQVHEIFTIDDKGNISDTVMRYYQGEYTEGILNGVLYVMDLTGKSLSALDVVNGNIEEIFSQIPVDLPLFNGYPKALLGDWLVVEIDLVGGSKYRCAINLVTKECRSLERTYYFNGTNRLCQIYSYYGGSVLICSSEHWEEMSVPSENGSTIVENRPVEDWFLIDYNSFLSDDMGKAVPIKRF